MEPGSCQRSDGEPLRPRRTWGRGAPGKGACQAAIGDARTSLAARSPLAPQKIYTENRMQECTVSLNARYIVTP